MTAKACAPGDSAGLAGRRHVTDIHSLRTHGHWRPTVIPPCKRYVAVTSTDLEPSDIVLEIFMQGYLLLGLSSRSFSLARSIHNLGNSQCPAVDLLN